MDSLTVAITAAVAVRPSTLYSVMVNDDRIERCWCVRRQYSDFDKLHRRVIEIYKCFPEIAQHIDVLNSKFPRKHLFGSRNNSVVQSRVKSLELFLRFLIHSTTLPSIKQAPTISSALFEVLEEFLACPTRRRYNGTSIAPLEPTGRLLSGKSLQSLNSSKKLESYYTNTQTAADDWNVAGDAVGLWAAGAYRKHHSDCVHSNPMVFKELILDQ